MLIPNDLLVAMPPWNSTEGVAVPSKTCWGRLMTLCGERTLYLVEVVREGAGWVFFGVSKALDQRTMNSDWNVGAWTDKEIENYRDKEGNGFMFDPYFQPCTVGELTSAFNEEQV